MSRSGGVVLLLALACARGGQPAADTADVATEPEAITGADTLGPPPVLPTFQLMGTEPFWGLRIESTGLTFTTPVDIAGQSFARTTPVMVGDTLRWNSIDRNGRTIEALVIAAPCSDGMSDKRWSHVARVTIGTERYEGCAERR